MSKVVHEFYANLIENIFVPREKEFEKVYVRAYVYDFSPKVICNYLNTPYFDLNENKKDYVLDDVASELLGTTVWPRSNALRVTDLTLKYSSLHKIVLSNWLPTKHVTSVFKDHAIGTSTKVILGQLFFYCIIGYRCGENKTQKSSFPSLIFRLF